MHLTIASNQVTLDGVQARLDPPLTLAEWAADLTHLHTFALTGAQEAQVDPAYLADLGRRLFRRIFVGEVLAAYQNALAAGPFPLGLSVSGSLAALPWELLYDPDERFYLGAAGQVTLYRRGEVALPTPPSPAVPTRLLLVFAPPGDPPLYAPSEIVIMVREALGPALADGRVALDWELTGTVATLNDRLNDPATRPHLVHFVGHGSIEDGQGVLGFVTPDGDHHPLGGERLRELFAGKGVQGVLLTACHSGQATGAADPLAMVAQALLRAGVPVVVAQQFAARVETTHRFFGRLYVALADGDPLERAAAFGRHALWVEAPPGDDNPLGFAVPVCYLAAEPGPSLGPAPAERPAPPSTPLRPGWPEPPGLTAVESVPPNFTGREEDVRRAEAAWRERRMVALCGGGGVGKTALAIHLAHANTWRLPGGIFWASARGVAGFTVDHAAQTVLRGLGIDPAGVKNPADEARRQLEGCTSLLVLDNFEEVPKKNRRPIYKWLRSLPQETMALFTSRERLDVMGLRALPLAPLDRAAARGLFVELLADRRGRALVTGEEAVAVESILKLLGGWPLALEIVAALAADASLAAILADLRSDRAEALAAEIEEEEISIVRSLGASYDRLAVEDGALFRRLGVLWGDFGLEVAAAVAQVEGAALEQGLAALVKRSLLERLHPAFPRWQMHGAVALFARSRLKAEEGEGAVRAARLRAAEYFRDYAQLWRQGLDTAGLTQALRASMDELRPQLLAQLPPELRAQATDEQLMELVILTGVAQARSALEAERANVGAAIQWAAEAGEHGLVQELVDVVDPFLSTAGYWHDLVQYERLALAAARAEGDERAVAVWAHNLAVTLYGLGEKAEAEALYRESLELKQKLGDEVMGIESSTATTLHQMGMLAQSRGDYEGALEYYRRSLEIKEQLGDRAGVAQSLHQIGMVHQARGDYEAALEHYRRSLEMAEQLGDRAGLAKSLGQIGSVLDDRGQWDEAIEYYERALRELGELGEKAGVAALLHNIGVTYQKKGDYEAALEHYRRSLEIKEQLGDRAGVASSLGQIGRVAQLQGDYVTAVRLWVQALATFGALGMPERDIIVGWFARLREELGAERFEGLLREAGLG